MKIQPHLDEKNDSIPIFLLQCLKLPLEGYLKITPNFATESLEININKKVQLKEWFGKKNGRPGHEAYEDKILAYFLASLFKIIFITIFF